DRDTAFPQKRLQASRVDLDVDCDRLADPGDCFSAGREHQIEVATIDRRSCYTPAGPLCFVHRRDQSHVECDRFRYAVHGEFTHDVGVLWAGLLYAAALEHDLREFGDVEKFRTAQVIVALLNPSVDAPNFNPNHDRGIFRVVPIDVDLAFKLRKLPA